MFEIGTLVTGINYNCYTVTNSNALCIVTNNINDYNNGYAGNGNVIDAVRVYYNTPADYANKYGYQKAQYRVSPVNANYYAWQYDDDDEGVGQDGYAGAFGKAIDRFQLF